MKANVFSFAIDQLHERTAFAPAGIYEMICLIFRDFFYDWNLSGRYSQRM